MLFLSLFVGAAVRLPVGRGSVPPSMVASSAPPTKADSVAAFVRRIPPTLLRFAGAAHLPVESARPTCALACPAG